jgi:hypothetical protein
MKRYLFFFLAIIGIHSAAQAQGTVSGQVVDAETSEPLAGASVFAQNTTKGTITDKEGKFSLYLPKGGYEIVVSYTGYTSKKINLELSGDREFNLKLEKGDNALSEVIIRNTNEVADGWEQYGKFFIEHFIGATPAAANAKLLNPEVLKFLYYKRNNRLKVLATEPLLVENLSLGYNIRYELDSFVHYFGQDLSSYKGFTFYTEMEGDEAQKQSWKENRKRIYYGSRLHFLRAYYDSTLSEEGFNVDIYAPTRFNKFAKLANPYDTSYYFFDDSTGIAELWFPVKVSITYTKKAPEKEYLMQYKLPRDVPRQISYVDLSEAILIKSNGYFTDQKNWVNAGYWSWKNLADQLPFDYEPDGQ